MWLQRFRILSTPVICNIRKIVIASHVLIVDIFYMVPSRVSHITLTFLAQFLQLLRSRETRPNISHAIVYLTHLKILSASRLTPQATRQRPVVPSLSFPAWWLTQAAPTTQTLRFSCVQQPPITTSTSVCMSIWTTHTTIVTLASRWTTRWLLRWDIVINVVRTNNLAVYIRFVWGCTVVGCHVLN